LTGYLLVISTQAPYHSSAAIDGFEAALAATNVGLKLKYLFQHDGVFQLINPQAPQPLAHKNTYKKLTSLPLFDVEDIYACQQSIDTRELCVTNNGLDWQSLTRHETLQLIKAARQVLVF
jgi:tRNA 2-thiouridine synthesizing protein C